MAVTQAQTWAHDYEGNDFFNEIENFDEFDPDLAAALLTAWDFVPQGVGVAGWDFTPEPNQRRFAHYNAPRAHAREEWVRAVFFAEAGIGSAYDLNATSLTQILTGLV